MMTCAHCCKSGQYCPSDDVHPVELRFHPGLLGIDAAFLVKRAVAQETRRDDLVLRRVRRVISATCSIANSLYGMFALKALLTQSRHAHTNRGLSLFESVESAYCAASIQCRAHRSP